MTIPRRRSFDVKRILAAGNAALLSALLYASAVQPDGFVMSLADQSVMGLILRSIALFALIVILVSHPPRSMLVRYILGASSSAILLFSFVSMTNYTIGIIDAIVYLQVSIILAIEALEFHPVRSTPRRIPIGS